MPDIHHMLNGRKVLLAFALLGLGLGVEGCSTPQLAAEATKKAMRKEEQPSTTQFAALKPGGVYKVGNPYQVAGVWYHPKEDPSYNETGIASWYGHPFHGKATANGETYDMNELTAAHKTLPMPVMVRVTNLENGRSVVLRVNDRGPFVNGRIIDVSRRGAQLLGFEGKGTAAVRVEIISPDVGPGGPVIAQKVETPPEQRNAIAAVPIGAVTSETLAPPPGIDRSPPGRRPEEPAEVSFVGTNGAPKIYVQAGAFSQRDRANSVVTRIQGFDRAFIQPVAAQGRELYRVRIGPLASVEQADAALDRAIKNGFAEARIVID